MNKDQYDSLVSSPGWEAMKTYLMDSRKLLRDKIAEVNIPASDIQLTIARCQTAKDLAEIGWPDIAKFYGIPLVEQKENKEAA